MKSTVNSVYGSVSGNGQTLDLQVNTDAGEVNLALPTAQLSQLFTLLIQLSQQAGEAQGLPAIPSPALYTKAVRIASAAHAHAVVDPTTSALFAFCGAVSFALEIPHKTVLQVAQAIQDLQAD